MCVTFIIILPSFFILVDTLLKHEHIQHHSDIPVIITPRTFRNIQLFFSGKGFSCIFNSYLPVVLSATTFPPSCSKYSSEFKKKPFQPTHLQPLPAYKKPCLNFQMFDTVGIFSHQFNLLISFLLFARSHMIINAMNSPSQVFHVSVCRGRASDTVERSCEII